MLKIIKVKNGNENCDAVFSNELPLDEDLKELVKIIMGENRYFSELLRPVSPGSVPDIMGAKSTLLLALEKVPMGGFGESGIYGIANWVSNILDKEMPRGFGAALTQPALFTLQVVDKNEYYYVVVISPMKKPNFLGSYIGDPHDSKSSTLIFY